MAQGNLAFVEALVTFNKNKSSFSTHLWWQLKHYLYKNENLFPVKKIENIEPYQDKKGNFLSELYLSCSPLAKEVLNLIFNENEHIVLNKKGIINKLSNIGWKFEVINNVLNEIKFIMEEK
jgi:hypothetical protein